MTRRLRVLSASEIGTYGFCPQAWYLDRMLARRSGDALGRLELGTRAHRELGQRAERMRRRQRWQRWVLVLCGVLLAAIGVDLARVGGGLTLS